MADHFDAGHLIGHVKDAEYFEVPRKLADAAGSSMPGKLPIPQFREIARIDREVPGFGASE